MTTQTLLIPPRFNGPPGAANGGIACGAVAGALANVVAAAAEVRLHRPVPLGRSLDVRRVDDETVVLEDSGDPVATGRMAPDTGPDLTIPEAVDAEAAIRAAQGSTCLTNPVFPDCVGCGAARAAGDGLRIFPGRVAGRSIWAAPWTPHRFFADADGRIPPEIVWAALDCPSGFAAAESALDGGAVPAGSSAVLGQMCARIDGLPEVGALHVVVAWPIAVDGRKLAAGSALLSPAGEVLAAARTTWITVAAPAPLTAGSRR